MPIHYIPDDDVGKLMWFKSFDLWLQAHGAGHGISPAQIVELSARAADFNTAMVAHERAQAAAKAATAEKNGARTAIVTLGRKYVRVLQADLSMTDAERAAAGLTVPDRIPTPTDPEAISAIKPPLLLLDFRIRHQVTIHWGPNPGNERRNARPVGTYGCEIQFARGGVPADASGWTALKLDRKSPFTHHIEDTKPTTYIYRARYIGIDLEYGPFGAHATCTVSV